MHCETTMTPAPRNSETFLPRDEDMFDPNFCLGKEAEYLAKAKITADPGLKSAYEATAREYAYRVRVIGSATKF